MGDRARMEWAFLVGDWDGAVRYARAALATAAAAGDPAAAATIWRTLRPIAAHRDDVAILRELGAWAAASPAASVSPADRLFRAATDLTVAATEGVLALPAADHLRASWALVNGDPGFVAARDAVLQAWLDDGRYDDVEAAIAALPVSGPSSGSLSAGAALLWRARFGRHEAEIVDLARQALAELRRWGAAWWIEQTIAVLEDAGAATPAERRERRAIRVRLLGVPTG